LSGDDIYGDNRTFSEVVDDVDLEILVIDFTDATGLEISGRESGEAVTIGEDVMDVEGVSYAMFDSSLVRAPGRTHWESSIMRDDCAGIDGS
jgi:hypothetical protein